MRALGGGGEGYSSLFGEPVDLAIPSYQRAKKAPEIELDESYRVSASARSASSGTCLARSANHGSSVVPVR